MSSGLLGVEGGLIRDGDEMPSLLIFRSSRILKLRLSEFCRKKPGFEDVFVGVSGTGDKDIGE